MNIYHSLKNHSLLNYMHKYGCCDLKMLAYYRQYDIIEELKKNYEPIATEMEELYSLSELQTEKEEESGKEESGNEESGIEESDSKPREIEYMQGLDDLLESIKKSGSIRRSDKEVLMTGINNKGPPRAYGLHKPFYISPECSNIVKLSEKKNNFKIQKEEKTNKKAKPEVEMRDIVADKLSYVTSSKRGHLPRVDISAYYREQFQTKRQRDKKPLKRSHTIEKLFEKKFEGIFNGKEFIEQDYNWDIPYFMRSEQKVKEHDSESEKLEGEEIIPKHIVDREEKVVAQPEVQELKDVPQESKQNVKDSVCFNEVFAGRDGDETENEALMIREELRTPSEISSIDELEISDSDSLLFAGTVVKEKMSERELSEREVEEVRGEKKEETKGLPQETQQEVEDKPLVTKAANLKRELHKYVLDEMIKVVMPHFECKRQHPEYKKVHRNLITQEEHLNLLSTLTGDLAQVYEEYLIEQAKQRSRDPYNRWSPNKSTERCFRDKIFYPFTDQCLKFRFNYQLGTPRKPIEKTNNKYKDY